MSFIDNYKPPSSSEVGVSFKDEPYDTSSNIHIPAVLETDRVQLMPFIPSIHAEAIFAVMSKHPEIERHIAISWPTLESFFTFHKTFVVQQHDTALFAIIDKTKPPISDANNKVQNGRIAGMIGWLHASPQNLSVEIGPVVILPEFQRTFVSANAIGLLLRYFLNLPVQGGLGYRRVMWTTNILNEASIAAAKKMQFVMECVTRWSSVLREGKEGKPVDGTRGLGEGRDSAILSLCWDEWEAHAKEVVTKRMERV